jgi:toxin-antitoxin system PIN domain toxin
VILIDANVLVYAVNADAPHHTPSQTALQGVFDGKVPGVLFPQVLLEFYAVVTHPRRVTRPLDPVSAWEQVARLRAGVPVLDVRPAALTALADLVTTYRPVGGGVFDLFLVAQMRAHSLRTVCTYDTAGFSTVAGVEALTPEQVLSRYGPQTNESGN